MSLVWLTWEASYFANFFALLYQAKWKLWESIEKYFHRKRITALQCLKHEWLNPTTPAKADADVDIKPTVDGDEVFKPVELSATKKNMADNKEHWNKDYVVFDAASKTMTKLQDQVQIMIGLW